MVGVARTPSGSRARRAASMTGCSSARSASSSRVPCRNSIGIATSRRCCGALVGRLAGRMQREADEDQAAHARQRRRGLRLRRHPAAERLAAGKQRQTGCRACGLATAARTAAWATAGGSGRRAPFSIDGNWKRRVAIAALGEAVRDRRHERMGHAGAGSVREDVERARLRRNLQQRGNRRAVVDRDRQRLRRAALIAAPRALR